MNFWTWIIQIILLRCCVMVVCHLDCSTIKPYKGTRHTSIPLLGARRGHPKTEPCLKLSHSTRSDPRHLWTGWWHSWWGGRLANLNLSWDYSLRYIQRAKAFRRLRTNNGTKDFRAVSDDKQQKAAGSRNSNDQEEQWGEVEKREKKGTTGKGQAIQKIALWSPDQH